MIEWWYVLDNTWALIEWTKILEYQVYIVFDSWNIN